MCIRDRPDTARSMRGMAAGGRTPAAVFFVRGPRPAHKESAQKKGRKPRDEKREKNDFWNRREAFARAIERDTKEKSEEVAQRLAQAVRADEEKQAKRQAARAGAGAQKAEPQAPRARCV